MNVTGATNIHKRVTKKASLIRKEFTRLADKMLEQGMLKRAKNEAVTHFLARNLGEILKHEEKICRMVLQESNALAEGDDDDDDYNPPIGNVFVLNENSIYLTIIICNLFNLFTYI